MTRGEIIKQVILDKCSDRENSGYDFLTDSDIIDIIEILEDKGITLTREEILFIFEDETEVGMTREEAIEILYEDLEWAEHNMYPYISKQKQEALKMAIEALRKE